MIIFISSVYIRNLEYVEGMCTIANGLNIIMNTIHLYNIRTPGRIGTVRNSVSIIFSCLFVSHLNFEYTHNVFSVQCSMFSIQYTSKMLSAQLRIRSFETFRWIWFSPTKNNGWLISLFLTDEQRSSITNRRIWVDTQVIQPTRYAYYYINVWWMNRYEGVR